MYIYTYIYDRSLTLKYGLYTPPAPHAPARECWGCKLDWPSSGTLGMLFACWRCLALSVPCYQP